MKTFKIAVFRVAVCLAIMNHFFPFLHARTEAVKFDRLSINDGLSNSYVTCIIQDSKGFMWFGTQDGLNKYDGYNFTVYKHDATNRNSLSDNYVRSICQTENGFLWIGSENGGLTKFDPAIETFTHHTHEPDNPNSLSHNSVTVICESRHDGRDILWIGTNGNGLDRFDPQSNSFTHYSSDPDNPNSLSSNFVSAIHEDESGNLWIGTTNGLNKLDTESKNWTHYCHDPSNPNSLTHSTIWSMYEDNEGTLWIGTYAGLNRMEADTSTGFEEIIQGYGVQSLCEDQFGYLWVGSYLGVVKYDPERSGRESLTSYKYDTGDPKSLSGTPVTSIYEDRSGMLWFGIGGGGISKLNRATEHFRHYRHIPGNPNSLSHPSVRGIYEDEDGILWVGGYGGLNRIDRKTGHYENYRRQNAKMHQLDTDLVYTIIGDPENKNILWIGTEGNGLYQFDKNSGKVKHYLYHSGVSDPYGDYILSDNFVFDLYLDPEGMLWIATGNGLNRLNTTTDEIIYYQHDPDNPKSLSGNDTRVIYEDHKGFLWIGTEANGLSRLSRDNGQTEHFTRYLHDPNNPLGLSNNRIKSIYEDRKGALWIGTNGGGLNRYDRETETFKHYAEKDGLPNDVVYGILEDDNGNLWLSTNRGLSRFNPETGEFRNYDVNDGLQSNEFNTASYLKSKSGEMFFGGINGFNAFYPDEVKDNVFIPPIVITDFQISNKSVPIGEMQDGRTILQRHISDTEEMELTYKDYLFSFEFAALSYAAPGKNRYAYKMEGFDSDWLYTDAKKRFATYTSLSAGNYVFKVKGSNNDGVWNEAGTSIGLKISPPPWKTWWAYTIYVIIVGLSLYAVVRFEIRQGRLKNQLKLEHMEAGKLQELDRMKSHFFSNISHEFRTPLTLIRGYVEDVRDGKHEGLSPSARKKLKRSLHNVRNLENLVDQLLDLSRLEAGKLTLQVKRSNLVGLIRRIIDAHSAMAKRQRLTMEFKARSESIELFYDEGMIEKVITNLLHNALKFTPEGGRIAIVARDAPRHAPEKGTGVFATIQIMDTGVGIPSEAIGHIFDRFYQVDSSSTRGHEGTGIGLALAKELVESHGGEISVKSEVERGTTGTTFTVTLPKGRDHFADDEFLSMGEESIPPEESMVVSEEKSKTTDFDLPEPYVPAAKSIEDATVLVVEDNAELRAYLREHLGHKYHVEEAADGEEGLRKAREMIPEVVVCDIMMPKMDGLVLTRELKRGAETNAISVILLTARAGEEDRISGLETKADDYVAKPFSIKELQLRVKNLIEARRQLQKKYSREVLSLGPDEIDVEPVNRTFLKNVMKVVEDHLSDTEFNVELLARGVFLSDRQLRRRLKSIIGLSPVEFIRQLRLKRAKHLLEHQAVSTVAEACYAVGFNTVGYFSRLYQQTFGEAPGDLIRR